MHGTRVARVMIDSPVPALDHLFDYAVPDGETVTVGCRVRVPLRSAGRTADAFVVEIASASDFEGELSPIEAVVSAAPVLAPEVWRLARRAADRAAGSASDIVRLAVPKRQVRVEKAWLAARGRESPPPVIRPVDVTGYADAASIVAPGARTALDAVPRLTRTPDGTSVGRWTQTVAQLVTLVLAEGRQAIVCVPDYRDQEQLEHALRAVVPEDAIVRFDARQPNAERYSGFLRCLEPGPRVVVGNRSAVYAPAADLGLLVVWDDADDLHEEPLAPYVHTRDAALLRQEDSGCALVLAGHARSINAQRLVELGWLSAVSPERVARPRFVLTAEADSDRYARIPSGAWSAAREALESGPVLVQVARPGYAPVVACRGCRAAARCTACGGALGIRSHDAPPTCTLCGRVAAGWSCGRCGDTRLNLVSRGSLRTREELGRAFPGTLVVSSDGDTPVVRVPDTPALVVATRGAEPVPDGGYAAVLLLDGERMLARESLDIALDCLRWWANAAALARDGAPVMLIGVGGPLAQALATWTPAAFASAELSDRRALSFPPAVRTASVTGELDAVDRAVRSLDRSLYRDVLGPTETANGVRSVIRFDYANGAELAEALRAAVIRASARRRRAPAGKGGYRPAPPLRVRFDETEILG